MNEEQPIYKVTDRRMFNLDGSPREVPAEEKPAPKPEPKPEPNPEPLTVSSTPEAGQVSSIPEAAAADQTTSQPADQEFAEHETEMPDVDDPASFANFLMSIASNAASALGMMAHPVTGSREVDLELGKHWIDILGMLQKKTSGNLLPQEQKILEGLLADLRMQYVSLSNATPAAKPAYSSRDITGG